MLKIVILGSGRGSNAEAILRAWQEGRLGKAEPAAILCDVKDAPILSLGERYGVPAEFVDPGSYRTRLSKDAEEAYVQKIRSYGAGLVVLAGFMRVIKEPLLRAFPRRIINLHPSLLPSFPGLNAIGQALEAGVVVTGCTVHEVNAGVDTGPIIDQEPVRVERGDTEETLATRVHAAEHRLLPRVIARLSEEFEM